MPTRRPSLSFAAVHAAPRRFTEVFFNGIKKLDTLPWITLCPSATPSPSRPLASPYCSSRHHKAITDRLLFSRCIALYGRIKSPSSPLSPFAHPFVSVVDASFAASIFAGDNAARNLEPRHFPAGVSCVRGKCDNPWAAPA